MKKVSLEQLFPDIQSKAVGLLHISMKQFLESIPDLLQLIS